MQELADSISVSKQLIGQIEKGNRSMTLTISKKLTNFFGINDLVTDDTSEFFTKDFLNEIELLKVKKAKIVKENKLLGYGVRFVKETGKNSDSHGLVEMTLYDNEEIQEIDNEIEKVKILKRINEEYFGNPKCFEFNKMNMESFIDAYMKVPSEGCIVLMKLIYATAHYYKIDSEKVWIDHSGLINEIDEVLKKYLDKEL